MEQSDFMEDKLVKELSQPLANAAGWMKFIGISLIALGSITALTIVGLITAWLPIWLGVILLKASNNARSAFVAGDKKSLIDSLLGLNNYFTINGVLVIIMLLLAVLGIVFAFAFGLFFQAFDPDLFQI